MDSGSKNEKLIRVAGIIAGIAGIITIILNFGLIVLGYMNSSTDTDSELSNLILSIFSSIFTIAVIVVLFFGRMANVYFSIAIIYTFLLTTIALSGSLFAVISDSETSSGEIDWNDTNISIIILGILCIISSSVSIVTSGIASFA